MLAETSTTDISRKAHPENFNENQDVARRGGNVAKIARQALEAETGEPVISSKNAVQLNQAVTDMIESAAGIAVEQEKRDRQDAEELSADSVTD